MDGFMQQAKEMQEKFERMQNDMQNSEVTGDAGAGMVKVCLLYTSPSPRDRG